MHCAAMLAHDTISDSELWTSNVDGTRNIAQACRASGVRQTLRQHLVATASGPTNLGHEVRRRRASPPPSSSTANPSSPPKQALKPPSPAISTSSPSAAPPSSIAGRLGLLAILFEFIEDGRKRVWVVGSGANRYQFIYAQDLATACIADRSTTQGSDLFHIGSDRRHQPARGLPGHHRRRRHQGPPSPTPQSPHPPRP